MSALRVYAFRCDQPGCGATVTTTESNATTARGSVARLGWNCRIVRQPPGFPVYFDYCPSHSEKRATAPQASAAAAP
jgi:hypothetical protein